MHAILLITVGCGEPTKARRSARKDVLMRDNLVQESWNMRIALTESGKYQGVIEASHGVEYNTKRGSEYDLDNGIRVTFFDLAGLATTTITANKTFVHDTRDIEVIGDVVMTSKDGVVMRTESFKRSASDGMIRSDRFVTITRQEETIQGEGFESDQSLRKYRIFRGRGEALIKQK